ncbi:diaminobutyrate acetyltransferase [Kutzneria sp. CA-103260]|uniref:diaminobutyrate acetyltransferase n=1 Tax=Kutzneria sp. CA-103260 TaxID=2802641 RepID=UPI001BAB61D5|nr:diaminobutyrate acetyltransferase [Kutzneria sp. CA-103260]QUQ67850.1 L-2,4-diaminobutyric acid acetyltransferase [Kutzneria sp. CA-103260]
MLDSDQVAIERPSPVDGRELWRLARDSAVLDLNSSYAYLLWTRDFADTSAVARGAAGAVGFVSGYRRPDGLDTLMVWQVAVAESHRGRGLARAMLDELVGRVRPRFLETTIAPANDASIRLFTSLARAHDVELARSALFTPELFPDEHEAEQLYRIGPWPNNPRDSS